MFVCGSVGLSFVHDYTFHPIAMKLWDVVDNTPGEVSAEKSFNFAWAALRQGAMRLFSIYGL